eukprot:TRINITY_DN8766_c0_g3_i4.p1 TRINITY_DN8766_c0_g3~~TRINITY_DN8766_c0_g3_i4.p1  ORF type:complete len:140 (+),score=29.75 TRINITY_DN8766_c0_g3_i4:950-1369(+)
MIESASVMANLQAVRTIICISESVGSIPRLSNTSRNSCTSTLPLYHSLTRTLIRTRTQPRSAFMGHSPPAVFIKHLECLREDIYLLGRELFIRNLEPHFQDEQPPYSALIPCLLYTSDAADEEDSGDLGGRRIIKKKKK